MSQLTITLSDKADALIAQLQKEIFNRRRKKVSAAGVIETLVESGAKSQSDKRFATSWTNLVADIEKAARVAHAHGAKPANLSDEEWALVLSHRIRAEAPVSSSRSRAGRSATTRVTRRSSARPAKAQASDAADPASAPAAPKAAVKRTTTAKSVVKPARTTRKASSTAAKAAVRTAGKAPTKTAGKAPSRSRTTRAAAAPSADSASTAGATKGGATKAGASKAGATRAKAAPKSTGVRSSSSASRRSSRRADSTPSVPAATDAAAIPAPSSPSTPTRSRRKAGTTTTTVSRNRSTRVSAATRMAKAASRLGATTSASPVVESAPVALAVGANGSSPAAAELA